MTSASSLAYLLALLAIFSSISVHHLLEVKMAPPVYLQPTGTKVLDKVQAEFIYCNPCRLVEDYENANRGNDSVNLKPCNESYAELAEAIEHLAVLAEREKESVDSHGNLQWLNLLESRQKLDQNSSRLFGKSRTQEELLAQQLSNTCANMSLEDFPVHEYQFFQYLMYPSPPASIVRGPHKEAPVMMKSVHDSLKKFMKYAKEMVDDLADAVVRRRYTRTISFNVDLIFFTSSELRRNLAQPTNLKAPGHLRFAFYAPLEHGFGPIYTVYKVKAFAHWRNLADTPRLVEYTGPPYVLIDILFTCIAALNESVKYAEFLENPWTAGTNCRSDTQFISWSEKKTNEFSLPSSYLATLDSTFVYCFPNEITIKGYRPSKCPPWVFKPPEAIEWTTSDNVTFPPASGYSRAEWKPYELRPTGFSRFFMETAANVQTGSSGRDAKPIQEDAGDLLDAPKYFLPT